MEVEELKAKLSEFRPFIIVSGKEIDKSNEKVKEFIELYYKLTGKRVGEGSCRNCIFDAYMEISIKTEKQLKLLVMPSKFKMREGRVVVFNNTDYTNANMTDEVALAMVAFNSKHAGNFVNPGELLEAFSGKMPPKGKEKVIVIEKKVEGVKNTYSDVLNEIEKEESEQPPTLDELKAAYKEKTGRAAHYKWNYDRLVEKLNEN